MSPTLLIVEILFKILSFKSIITHLLRQPHQPRQPHPIQQYLSFAGMQLESGTQQREEEAEMGAMPNFALQSAIDEYVDRMAAKLPELEERPLLEVC